MKHFFKKLCAVLLAVLTVVSMLTVMIVEQPMEVYAMNTTLTSTSGGVTATWKTYTRNGEDASTVSNTPTARLEAHSGSTTTHPENYYYYGTIRFEITSTPALSGYTFSGWNALTIGGTSYDEIPGGTIPSSHAAGNSVCSKIIWRGTDGEISTSEFHATIYAVSNGNIGLETRQFVFKATALFTDSSGNTTTKTYTWNASYYVMNTDGKNTYTVKYDANTSYGGVATTAPASQLKVEDVSLTLTSSTPTNCYGYDFKNWNTKADGSGTSYASGGTYTANASVTLYAQYDATYYTISYYSNYPSGTNTLLYSDSAPGASTYTVPSTVRPTYSGYTFKGWASSKTATSASWVAGDTWTMPTMNIAVYAVWATGSEASYPVVYFTNYPDGSTAGTVEGTYQVGTTVTVSSSMTPSYSNYTFLGWHLVDPSSNGANDQTLEVNAVAGDTFIKASGSPAFLRAVWMENSKCTITYNANGGSGAPSAQTKYIDEDITLSTTKPTRTGYNFAGWNTSADGSGTSYTAGATYTANDSVTLYAQWTANEDTTTPTYTITYKLGDTVLATQTKNEDTDVELYASDLGTGSTPTWISGPTKSTEWNTEPDGSGTTYAASSTYSANADLVLYAQPQQIVVYNSNYPDGTNTSLSTTTCDATATITISECSATYEGYKFVGWSAPLTGPSTTNDQTLEAEYFAGDEYTLDYTRTWVYTGNAANYFFNAVWRTLNNYTVTYDANGGDGAPTSQTKVEDTDLTLSITTPTKTGYTFAGWNTVTDGSGTAYASGGTYTANADVILYAQWTPVTYTVSYDANGGSGAPSAQTKAHDIALTLSSTTPTRDGYTFQGWGSSASDTSVDYASGASYTANASTTLYAIWKINTYPVTYDANEGIDAPSAQTKTHGTALTLSSTVPARTGYTFTGWNTEANGSGTAYASGTSYSTDAALTLYAQWTPVNYTITYNLDDGSNSVDNPTQYDVEDEFDFAEPTKDHYEFDGWFTDSEFKTPIDGIDEGTTGDIDVYAKWTPVEYPITYILYGGKNSASNPTTYNVEDAFAFADATRDYYTFNGWYADENKLSPITDVKAGTTGALTVYADWTPIDYDIIYNLDGGTNNPANPDEYNVETPDITLADPTKDGYDFEGWYEDEEFTTPITEIPEGSTGDIDVYAKWNDIYYDVNYNLDGGINDITNPGKVTYFDVAELKTPTKNGYEFLGWTDENGNEVTTLEEISSSVTLTANWKAVVYKITYLYNGGYSQPKNPTTYTIEDDVDLYGCYKPGDYVFYYWMDANGEKVMHLADGRTGDLTLYAHFEYVEGSGNIRATGEMDNTVASGALLTFTSLAIIAVLFIVLIIVRRRKIAASTSN